MGSVFSSVRIFEEYGFMGIDNLWIEVTKLEAFFQVALIKGD